MKHTGTVLIETERLILRRFQLTDAEHMFNNWANDPEVTKYLTWETHETIDTSKGIMKMWVDSYKEDTQYHWAIIPKDCNQVSGSITAAGSSEQHEHCEIGYCIGRTHWGKGLVTEALKAVIKHLIKEVGYERVGAIHYIENPASGRVMEKAGMTYEGRLRHYHKKKHVGHYDCECYGIISSDLD